VLVSALYHLQILYKIALANPVQDSRQTRGAVPNFLPNVACY